MQRVIRYIDARTKELEAHPFIGWLSNTSIPSTTRLSAWLPCAAFFVFGFKDLNAEALPYPEEEARMDPLKRAINEHGAEDSMHWPWYLSDLRTLGLDREMTLTEALRFLWGQQTVAQRRAVYRLYALCERAQAPIIRYCLIAALESYAHLLFATVTRVSEEFEEETGKRLQYLGATHFGREPGHMANQHDDTEGLVLQQQLDDRQLQLAIEIAGSVCDVIDQRWREFYGVAQSAQCSELAAAAH
jgi:hypothetical protein